MQFQNEFVEGHSIFSMPQNFNRNSKQTPENESYHEISSDEDEYIVPEIAYQFSEQNVANDTLKIIQSDYLISIPDGKISF